MPIVYGFICPRSPVDETQAARTATALRRLAEELAGYRPEAALLVSSTATPRAAMGVVTAREVAGLTTDQELAERVLHEAASDNAPLEAVRRGGDGPEVPAVLRGALAGVRALAILTSRLEPRFHFEFGRAVGRAVASDARRVAMICAGDLSRALAPGMPGYDRTGRVFDEHYRRAIQSWDVKWVVHLEADVRHRAAEDAVPQTAVLMGALSAYRIQPRVLSYEAPAGTGLLVAAIDVLGPRRRLGSRREV